MSILQELRLHGSLAVLQSGDEGDPAPLSASCCPLSGFPLPTVHWSGSRVCDGALRERDGALRERGGALRECDRALRESVSLLFT